MANTALAFSVLGAEACVLGLAVAFAQAPPLTDGMVPFLLFLPAHVSPHGDTAVAAVSSLSPPPPPAPLPGLLHRSTQTHHSASFEARCISL